MSTLCVSSAAFSYCIFYISLSLSLSLSLSFQRKCEQYWPDNLKEYKEFGHGIRVEVVSVTPYADFEMRKIVVTQVNYSLTCLVVI